jgi:hypothetical protein
MRNQTAIHSAQEYSLTFRGNTLADIQPRSPAVGYQLYADRSLEALREPTTSRKVERFVRAKPHDTVIE